MRQLIAAWGPGPALPSSMLSCRRRGQQAGGVHCARGRGGAWGRGAQGGAEGGDSLAAVRRGRAILSIRPGRGAAAAACRAGRGVALVPLARAGGAGEAAAAGRGCLKDGGQGRWRCTGTSHDGHAAKAWLI